VKMTDKSENLSCYILTCNSTRHLENVVSPIRNSVDDLVFVDSGSTDDTEEIAGRFGARFIFRKLDNFRAQRIFAIEQCRFRWVLCLDSDEVPDEPSALSLAQLKSQGFIVNGRQPDAFRIKRRWFVLGKEVRAFYPITSPDYPIRLFNRDKVGFENETRYVHETIGGCSSSEILEGSILHYSCDSIEELYGKLNLYTSLAVEDLKKKGAGASWFNILSHPIAAWLKWYIVKGGWKDGQVGYLLGRYAFDYTYQKYLKLRYDLHKH